MHGWGLAEAIAAEAAGRAEPWSRIRVSVHPSAVHGGGELDNASLAFQISMAVAARTGRHLSPSAIEIDPLPVTRLCGRCSAAFVGAAIHAQCPSCGGLPLPLAPSSSAELEFLR